MFDTESARMDRAVGRKASDPLSFMDFSVSSG